MQYIGSYTNPADIATKQNVEDVAPFVVTFTDNNGTITSDKTFAEIIAAISAKKTVMALFEAYVLSATTYNESSFISFCGVIEDGSRTLNIIYDASGTIFIYLWIIPNLDYISYGKIVKRGSELQGFIDAVAGEDYMAPVPVTAENDGSVLAVTGGEWGVQSLASETWTFTLEDGSEVTKTIVTGVSQAL